MKDARRADARGVAHKFVIDVLAEGRLDRVSRSRLRRAARALCGSDCRKPARSHLSTMADILAGVAALKVITTPPHAWGVTIAAAVLLFVSLAIARGTR